MEGFVCYEPSVGCDQTGLTMPRFAYDHSSGACAITGGFIYHGVTMPELAGRYIYGDYCNGRIFAFDGYGNGTNELLLDLPYAVTSFGQTADGEVYVVTQNNGILKLTHSP